MSDPEHKNDATPPATANTEPPDAPATNGAAPDTQPPAAEVMQVSVDVLPYADYVGRWVTVQFRSSYFLVDHVETDPRPDARGFVYGVPGPKYLPDGSGIPQMVLNGKLDVSVCGTALGLLLGSPDTGAVMRIVFHPKDIAYLTVVARLPPQQPEPSRIVMPGSN